MTTAALTVRPDSPAALARLEDKARGFISESSAPNTLRAYAADWRTFTAWCEARGASPLPAEPGIVAAYLADRASPDSGAPAKVSTLRRALTAINRAHQAEGHPKPSAAEPVRLVMRGVIRELGTAPTRKAPATLEVIQAMVGNLPEGPKGIRDRALILLGVAGAFRRAELAALEVLDLEFTAAGVVVTVRQSKTDQAGEGATVAVACGVHLATCPVRALRAWLELAGVTEGPVFRSVTRHGRIGESMTPKTVARVVKSAASGAGLDPDTFGAHSLRAGHATQARRAGAGRWEIKRQGRWKSDAVVEGYIREVDQWRDNTSAMLGL